MPPVALTGTVEARTEWARRFVDASRGELLMRMYEPEGTGPRPLILFLHGGGETGSDNWSQLVGTLGAPELAARYPDSFVLAPQAPAPLQPVMPRRLPFAERVLDPDSGWSRGYLLEVCDLIRALVSGGVVDGSRIYLTGVSMGGAGVLRALSVAPGLFAGAAPVCPTMTPETFDILRSLREEKLWISTAYVDHTPDRHKYIVDGVIHLLREGADVQLSLFSPEQLASVGIPADESASTDDLLLENHSSWELTYTNEDGILDWLVSQRLSDRPPLSH